MSLPTASDPLRPLYRRVALCGNAFAVFCYGVPVLRPQMTDENMLLESASAIAFLGAFLFGAAALSLVRGPGRILLAAIPLLGLLCFLDETSFLGLLAGETGAGDAQTPVGMSRLPGTQREILIGGYRIDAVHDFFTLGFKLWRDLGGPAWDAAGALLLGLAVGGAFLGWRRVMPSVMAAVRACPALDYLRFAVIWIVIALVLDLHVFDGLFTDLLDELCEANAALCLFFGAIAIPGAGREAPVDGGGRE